MALGSEKQAESLAVAKQTELERQEAEARKQAEREVAEALRVKIADQVERAIRIGGAVTKSPEGSSPTLDIGEKRTFESDWLDVRESGDTAVQVRLKRQKELFGLGGGQMIKTWGKYFDNRWSLL